jgi:nucleoside-triphosphatase
MNPIPPLARNLGEPMGVTIKIGITGLPNAGKTQALIKVIEMLEEGDQKVGGMITEPITKDNRRVGFYVMDWLTKEKDILAHVDFESKIMVGRYKVNLDALERVGVKAIESANDNCDIIIIDEVGRMEVESEKFVDVVKRVLEEDKPLILTLHKKSRNPLLQDIRRRDDVRILEVTPINRNLLPYKIIKLMKGDML